MNATAYRQPSAPKAKNTLLIVLIVILAVLFAIYSGIWLVLKNRTENELAKIQPQLPIEFTYSVGGYPFHLKVTLHGVVIPQLETEEDAAMMQSLGFTSAKGAQLRAVGDTIFSMGIFGKSTVMIFPIEYIVESQKQTMRYVGEEPVVLELSYSMPNAAIISNILMDAPTPEPKELLSRFRELSFHDKGGKMLAADGSTQMEWSGYDLTAKYEPEGTDVTVSLNMAIQNLQTSSDYYTNYFDNLGEYQGGALLFKDFASYILDYPYYDFPVSMDLDLYAKVPMDSGPEKPFQGQFALTRLSVRDKNGESVQSGNLTLVRAEGAPAEAYGDFTWKAQNFPHSLSRYAGLASSLLEMVDARRDEITALSGKPVNVPPAAESKAVVAVVEKQIKEFLTGLGALKGNDLFLTIEKKQGGALTVNGKTEAEVQLLFQQHAMPALQVLGATQQQQSQ